MTARPGQRTVGGIPPPRHAWAVALSCLSILFSTLPPVVLAVNAPGTGPEPLALSAYAKVFCQPERPRQAAKAFALADFWSMGLYSANIDYELFEATAADAGPTKVQSEAAARAVARGHAGYAFGICQSRPARADSGTTRFWILTTAAPLAFDKTVEVAGLTNAVSKHCRGFKIMLSPVQGSNVQQVSLPEAVLFLQGRFRGPLPNRTAAFYCLPSDSDQGPWLWGLVPVPNGRVVLEALASRHGSVSAGRDDDPGKQVDLSGALLDWLAVVRTQAALAPIRRVHPTLEEALAGLEHGQGVAHLRPGIARMRAELQKRGYRLLGENRFVATDIGEAQANLWLSPTHRALLLSPGMTDFALLPPRNGSSAWVFLGLKGRSWDQRARKTPPDPLQKSKASPPPL